MASSLAVSRLCRPVMAARACGGNAGSPNAFSRTVRSWCHAGSRLPASAASGGRRAATACSTSAVEGPDGGVAAMAASCWARHSRAMKRSHSAIGWPTASTSSRAAVRAKRLDGSGRTSGSGALTPPSRSPAGRSGPLTGQGGCRPAAGHVPAGAAICGDAARPSRASRSLASCCEPSHGPRSPHRHARSRS